MLAALRIQLSVVAGSIWHCSKVGATFLKVNDFFESHRKPILWVYRAA